MRRLIAVVSALLLAGPAALCVLEVAPAGALANGQTISFDEDPPSGLAQYTAIGVTYGTNNAGILPGLSEGDGGNWNLEGTNGSYFVGYNGPYSDDITFDETVDSASIDVARSNGSSDGTITLEALSGATVVDTDTVVLGDVNTWSTLTVSGPMDGVRITGDGTDFHPFGVDNLVIGTATPNGAPAADAGPDQTVTLDGTSVAVTLDGTGSSDPDDDPLAYTWTGDFTGGTATGAEPEVSFTTAGTHTITLTVDDGTDTDTDTVDVVVAAAAGPGPQPVPAQPTFTG